jgi:hypothetical protein
VYHKCFNPYICGQVYAAATDLEPTLAVSWGHNFETLISKQQQEQLLQQQATPDAENE